MAADPALLRAFLDSMSAPRRRAEEAERLRERQEAAEIQMLQNVIQNNPELFAKARPIVRAIEPAKLDFLDAQAKQALKAKKAQEQQEQTKGALSPLSGENVGPLAAALRGAEQLQVPAGARGGSTSPAVTRAALSQDPAQRARLLRQVGQVAQAGQLDTLDTQLDVGQAEAGLGLPSQRTGTEFERLMELDRRGQLGPTGKARLERLAAGSGGLTITTLPDGTTQVTLGGGKGDVSASIRDRVIDTSLNAQQGLGLVRGMIRQIQSDPSRAGFEATIRNAVDTGTGVLSSIDSFTGSNLTSLVSRGQQSLEQAIADGRAEDPRFTDELIRAETSGIEQLETEEFFLAFFLRDALTPRGRFSYAAVKQLQERLSLKDARGPAAVLSKLKVAERLLRNADKANRSRARSLGVQVPTVEFSDDLSGGSVPAAEFILNPDGSLEAVE